MYQELIARITAERDVRHATLTQMMINRLQELGAPSDVVMTAAVYYLHGVIATEDELAAQYGLPPSSVGYLQGLRCRGLKPKGKARVWEMNVRRYYFHVKGDIAGHPELELLQTVISEARIRTYTCAAGYGKGLSYLRAAEHDRDVELPAAHLEDLGGVVDDLIDRDQREVEGHELDDRPQPDHRGADADAGEPHLGDRRVDDAALAEALEQALGDLVRAVVVADLLAHDEHVGVAVHLLAHGLVERLAIADDGHFRASFIT